MFKYKINIIALFVFALFTSCSRHEEQEKLVLPLQLVVHSDMAYSSTRRIVGDPGTAERLDLPRYAYVFTVFKKISGDYDVRTIVQSDLYDGGKTDSEVWTAVDTGGDIVYRCLIKLEEVTPVLGQVEYCHVYAAVSKVPLTLTNTNPLTEGDVLNVQFNVDDEMQDELQNIYSTPYNNYIDGRYYGRLNVRQSVTSTDIVLYHVASKVDLLWNVQENKQSEMRITGIKAKNLFKGDSYLFRPTENVHSQFTSSDGYTLGDLVGDVAGTWWAGRTYFYTIPYRTNEDGKFPLQVDVDVMNTSADATYTQIGRAHV